MKITLLISVFCLGLIISIYSQTKQESIKELGPVLQDMELHLTQLKKKKNENQIRIMPAAEDQWKGKY